MTPKQALRQWAALSSSLTALATKVQQDVLALGEPEEDDDAGWRSVAAAQARRLDELRLSCVTSTLGFREVEQGMAKLHERLLAYDSAKQPVPAEDLELLQRFAYALGDRPASEDAGYFEGELGQLPLAARASLAKLMTDMAVSMCVPTTSAFLSVSDIEPRAEVQESPSRGLTARLRVRFKARMTGCQGDSLQELLKFAKVRVALPNRGPVELQFEDVQRMSTEPDCSETA